MTRAVGAGTFELVPPGLEHAFENRTDEPVRVLTIRPRRPARPDPGPASARFEG